MADRRMVHRKVVESDSFYNLSEGAQAIYLHLTINADEDGFINGAKSIVSRFKRGDLRLKELVDKRFVLQFGDVYVIKHWRIGNSLKSDRTKPPTYPSVAAQLWIKPNRAYTDHPVEGCETLLERKTGIRVESKRNPNGIQPESEWNPNGIPIEQNRTEEEMNSNEYEPNRTEGARSLQEDFSRLWMAYPEECRGTMQLAMEAFRMEITSEEDADTAIANLELWKQSDQWNKDGGQYIPYLNNWMGRGIWKTRPKKLVTSGSRELDDEEREAIRRMLSED